MHVILTTLFQESGKCVPHNWVSKEATRSCRWGDVWTLTSMHATWWLIAGRQALSLHSLCLHALLLSCMYICLDMYMLLNAHDLLFIFVTCYWVLMCLLDTQCMDCSIYVCVYVIWIVYPCVGEVQAWYCLGTPTGYSVSGELILSDYVRT